MQGNWNLAPESAAVESTTASRRRHLSNKLEEPRLLFQRRSLPYFGRRKLFGQQCVEPSELFPQDSSSSMFPRNSSDIQKSFSQRLGVFQFTNVHSWQELGRLTAPRRLVAKSSGLPRLRRPVACQYANANPKLKSIGTRKLDVHVAVSIKRQARYDRKRGGVWGSRKTQEPGLPWHGTGREAGVASLLDYGV